MRRKIILGSGFRARGSGQGRFYPQPPAPSPQLHGFTLVELMLVVVIIGVLAAMVVPRLAGRTEQAKISRAKSDIASIGLALDLYELDMGGYPPGNSLDPLLKREGLPAGANADAWKGPYLKKKMQDPWGKDYQYKFPSESTEKDYDLSSVGPDGQAGNQDDISN